MPCGRLDRPFEAVRTRRARHGLFRCVRFTLHVTLLAELRFIVKHTTCNDLTLLRGPHPAAQKGGLPVTQGV